MVHLGAILVQLAWKGWILCSQWTISGLSHREDGRYFPPWKGFSVPPSNSKSRVYPEQLSVGDRGEGPIH